MTYATDVQEATNVLRELYDNQRQRWKVQVCNADLQHLKPDNASAEKGALETGGTRPTQPAFYTALARSVGAMPIGVGGSTGFDCMGFAALLLHRLTTRRTAFTGNIDVGMIGANPKTGHVFLILHHNCCQNPTLVLDLWSFLHPVRTQGAPGPSALVTWANYPSLLPTASAVAKFNRALGPDNINALMNVHAHDQNNVC
ncbi:MAG: hypothetical protein EOP82_12765 [Variovorax sp.]|nr:MAG: hypothetical protein EOP82_12765 [Variovorax sp.]